MAGDDRGTDSLESPSHKGGMSSITLKAIPTNFPDRKDPRSFWDAYREHLPPHREGAGRIDYYEALIIEKFPTELEKGFRAFLSRAYPPGTATPKIEIKRREALGALRFYVRKISYGSLDIETIIANLDQVMEAFNLTVGVVISVLSISAPGALNSTLGVAETEWVIETPAVNIATASQPAMEPEQAATPRERTGAKNLLGSLYNPRFVWQLLNALWILPILVALFVLISTYREMNQRIASYDKDLLKVKTDEIARIAARTDQLDEQHRSLLERQETLFKESTDQVRAILADEVKQASIRAEYFDHQYAALLQRYESLARESAEVVKTLMAAPSSSATSSRPSARRPTARPRRTSR